MVALIPPPPVVPLLLGPVDLSLPPHALAPTNASDATAIEIRLTVASLGSWLDPALRRSASETVIACGRRRPHADDRISRAPTASRAGGGMAGRRCATRGERSARTRPRCPARPPS